MLKGLNAGKLGGRKALKRASALAFKLHSIPAFKPKACGLRRGGMHIDYKCSGGFGGLRLAFKGETDELPPEEARKLTELVEGAGIFNLTQKQLSENPQTIPDDFSCRLTISKGGKRKTLSYNEFAAPGNLRRLSAHLRKLAIKNQGR